MDISDGLVQDLEHLCRAAGLGARIDAAAVPLSPAARATVDDAALIHPTRPVGRISEAQSAPSDPSGALKRARSNPSLPGLTRQSTPHAVPRWMLDRVLQ